MGTRGLRIGLLAEDQTDCDAVAVLMRRIADSVTSAAIGINKHSTEGCGALRKKAPGLLRQMARDGCSAAVIVHDLDLDPRNGELNSEEELRARLSSILVPPGLTRWICIPIEELEAWFWADPELIAEIGRGSGKAHASPHRIKRPKEMLQRLSAAANGKPRYTTNHNAELARRLNLERCAERCPSFRDLREFVLEVVRRSSGADADAG